MSKSSLEYFLDRDYYGQSQSKSDIIGYFDFSDIANSGSINFTGNYFNKNNYLSLQIDNPNIFWGKSGLAKFDNTYYQKISGNLLNNLFCAIAINSLETGKEHVLFSSYGCNGSNCSGYRVSINKYGYPYIEYKDNVLDTKYFSYSKSINIGGPNIFYFGVDPLNTFFLGTFSNISKSIEEEVCGWSPSFNVSNTAYIGGDDLVPSSKYLSGYLKELVVCENGIRLNKNNITSGIIYKIIENTVTGVISGQTGILYGDVIEIKKCYVGASGGTGSIYSQPYSGIEYYVPTYQEFIDFNNETYSSYLYSGVSGVLYNNVQNEYNEYVECSNTITGYKIYEYDSGYKIEYKIKLISTVFENTEYYYSNKNKILFNFNLNSGDIVSLIYQKTNKVLVDGSNYFLNRFDSINSLYSNDPESINKISGLYYNGQYQIYDTNSPEVVNNKFSITGGDFTLINGNVVSNIIYNKPILYIDKFYSSIIADLWAGLSTNYINYTGLSSGQMLDGLNFSGSLVFLNGVLLTSGQDYILPNKILINIPSGDNVVSNINLNFEFKKNNYIINNTKNSIELNDMFVEKSPMIWLNGVRLYLGFDYTEN